MSMFVVEILESFLGYAKKHNESKGQIAFDCPACAVDAGKPEGDGKGNLEVNYDKGIFRCWSCSYYNHMSGPVSKLIEKYGNQELLTEYKILKPDIFISDNVGGLTVLYPNGFKQIAKSRPDRWNYNDALNYLTNRGIGMDIINKYRMGYTLKGEFRDRIIIPSFDTNGDLNYFIARSWDKKVKPKYYNPETEKQEIIFNENKINWDATIYLVEGVFDAIVLPNSIPLLGKFLSDKLFNELYTMASGNIVVLLDADAEEDALNLYRQLNLGNLEGRIRKCTPPEGYDPSKIYEKRGWRGIVRLLITARKLTDSELYQ